MSPEEKMVPVETLGLIGELMQASHNMTTHTLDQLHTGALRDCIELCDTIIELCEAINAATVMDRRTESRLADSNFRWRMAEQKRQHCIGMLSTMGVDVYEFDRPQDQGWESGYAR